MLIDMVVYQDQMGRWVAQSLTNTWCEYGVTRELAIKSFAKLYTHMVEDATTAGVKPHNETIHNGTLECLRMKVDYECSQYDSHHRPIVYTSSYTTQPLTVTSNRNPSKEFA